MESLPNVSPTDKTSNQQPHVAVCSSAGMGHLAPFLRLSSALSSSPYNCRVTLVVIVPAVTDAESNKLSSFFTSHPHIHRLDFPVEPSSSTVDDPFLFRYDTIRLSAHLLTPHLSSLSPPLSAVFSDAFLTKGLNTTLPAPIPNYTVITTSARFFSLTAYLPQFVQCLPPPGKPAEIPGLAPFPNENIPPPFFVPEHKFTSLFVSNSQFIFLSKGILLNTFDLFEPETLSALKSGRALPELPPVFPIGPLWDTDTTRSRRDRIHHKDEVLLSWLDEQPEKSIIYVSFGSRTAMSREQIRELGLGLERSTGCSFLWVVKTSMVDREEKDSLVDSLGEELYEKLAGKGKLMNKWVKQEEILGHRAVGGFVSHCGWNSVVEAAWHGVPILAWPQNGDQRENAGVVEKAGLGVWERRWGIGEGKLVGAAEIAEKVKLVMGMEELRTTARRVGEEAKKACEVGGSSRATLMSIVDSLRHCS